MNNKYFDIKSIEPFNGFYCIIGGRNVGKTTTFITDNFLQHWFGGRVEHWYSPKLKETHYVIENDDVGHYHFTIPDEKLAYATTDPSYFRFLCQDYLQVMFIRKKFFYGF